MPSVPGDPVSGVLAGLQDFPHRAALANLRLGTTVATNAMLERNGATVAYITTRGTAMCCSSSAVTANSITT